MAHPAGHPAVYDTFVALHVAAALVGFGAVAISGAYGALARRSPDGEETRRYFSRSGRAEYLILAVPFLGAAAMGFRPGGAQFGDLWVILGFVLWLAAGVLLLGVVRPAEEVIRTGPEGSLGARSRTPSDAGTRLMWGGAVCDVLFVAALLLMVTQPA